MQLDGPGKIYFANVEHLPTKGVALVARCTDTKTCTQFAAAYRTVAACQAERDKKLDGDPVIACQKKPSTFKLACAAKFPCSPVLRCADL